MSIRTITLNGQTINVVSLPVSPERNQVQFDMNDSVGEVASIFTGQTQLQQWPGADLLSGTMTLPPLTQAQADDWISFLMQCRGKANAFMLGDPLQTTPRGVATGTPFVDNSNGANLAGSQFLQTSGWTPNTKNILRRGDWMQLGWRLYRVLDDTNSDGNGNATFPVWPSLREQPTSSNVSPTITAPLWENASGGLTLTATNPLANWGFWCIWTDFSFVPGVALPPDAVIQGIYAVVVISAGAVSSDPGPSVWYGNALRPGDFISPGGLQIITPAVPYATGEFYAPTSGGSIGTSLDVLNGMAMYAQVWDTLASAWTSAIDISAVGFAIYYTSASPVIDGQIAPPFSVPGGQGLAWALPFGAGAGWQPGADPHNNGTSAATPTSYNGAVTTNKPTGLFRLATNKRSWSADTSRSTRLSFPVQENR